MIQGLAPGRAAELLLLAARRITPRRRLEAVAERNVPAFQRATLRWWETVASHLDPGELTAAVENRNRFAIEHLVHTALRRARASGQARLSGAVNQTLGDAGRMAGRQLRVRALGGPGSGNFGHSGRPGERGGSGPGGDAQISTEPLHVPKLALGETPLPPGMIRGYHYTRAIDAVLEQGILRSKAVGATYSEPNAIWMSAEKPGAGKDAVEIFFKPEELVSNGPASGEQWSQERIDSFNAGGNNFTVRGDAVAPERFVSFQRSWHKTYRYLSNRPEMVKRVLAGEFDHLVAKGDKDASAVQAIKRNFRHLRAAAPFAFNFDQTNPRALAYALARSSELITEVTESVIEAIQELVGWAFEEGIAPARLMYFIKEHIGLRADQVAALRKFAADEDHSEYEVDRYANKLLNDRAELIARTETMRSAGEGQRELWRQAAEEGWLPPGTKRKWIATMINDETPEPRTRPEHAAMHGQIRDLDTPFTKPDGTNIETGEEPNCRCVEGIASAEDIREYEERGSDWRDFVDMEALGGPGSGNFGHAGRPGERGGSGPGGGEVPDHAVSIGQSMASSAADGAEIGIAFESDEPGAMEIGKTSGNSESVDFPPGDWNRPGAGLVFHHTHPTENSFSAQDVLTLANREGARVMYAHTAGSTYRAEVIEEKRRDLYFAAKEVFGAQNKKVIDSFLTHKDNGRAKAESLESQHQSMLILRDMGLVKYSWVKREPRVLGGPGSGNFGHAGRPGERGGSGPGGGADKDPFAKDSARTEQLKAFEATIRNLPKERLLAITADGRALPVLEGDETGVDIPYTWQGYRQAGNPLFGARLTHNHPNGSALSPEDMGVFSHAGLAEIRAVGVDVDGNDVEYSLSAPPGHPAISADYIVEEYNLSRIEQINLNRVVRYEPDPKLNRIENDFAARRHFQRHAFSLLDKTTEAVVRRMNAEHGAGWTYRRNGKVIVKP